MKEYLHIIMIQLSNILHNGSQSVTKDEILNSIKNMLNDYNSLFQKDEGMQVMVKDFRDKE